MLGILIIIIKFQSLLRLIIASAAAASAIKFKRSHYPYDKIKFNELNKIVLLSTVEDFPKVMNKDAIIYQVPIDFSQSSKVYLLVFSYQAG